jgi:hypothetical protein
MGLVDILVENAGQDLWIDGGMSAILKPNSTRA